MKCTEYFTYTRKRPDRAYIKTEWIEHVILNFEHEEIQTDGRIKRWAFINEIGKYLRVILLPDKETVHNAFLDRNYRGNHHED